MAKAGIEAEGSELARPAGNGRQDFQELLTVEECVRYYPPNLEPVSDPTRIFSTKEESARRRQIDLFVDVPYCGTICGFCPFNVYPYDEDGARRYLESLGREIRAIRARYDLSRVPIKAVWVGGGTPSVLSEESLETLLSMLHENFDLTGATEFTIEVKPTLSTPSEAKFDIFRTYGVNRVSMGLQSTNRDQLRVLGRGHTPDDGLSAIERIKRAGFALNVDMLYRLPGQSASEVSADLDLVKGLGIDHMSWFPYVPHPGTSLADRIERGRVAEPVGRDFYYEMFKDVSGRLAGAGYEQYTPYHFAFTGPCEYHVDRWGLPQLETLGIGPGAFSFFNGWIYTNEHNPTRYASALSEGRLPVQMARELSPMERITRLAVLGIKLLEVDMETFRDHSGVSMDSHYAAELDLLCRAGLVEVESGTVRCTTAGSAFNNDVATIFGTDTARRTRHPQAVDLMRN